MPRSPETSCLMSASLAAESALRKPLASPIRLGSSEITTDWVAFLASALKSGSSRRPGSLAAATEVTTHRVAIKVRRRRRITGTFSRGIEWKMGGGNGGSSRGVVTVQDDGARGVQRRARDCQSLHQLCLSFELSLALQLCPLSETERDQGAGSNRGREPAAVNTDTSRRGAGHRSSDGGASAVGALR